jgi:hypothetical protein
VSRPRAVASPAAPRPLVCTSIVPERRAITRGLDELPGLPREKRQPASLYGCIDCASRQINASMAMGMAALRPQSDLARARLHATPLVRGAGQVGTACVRERPCNRPSRPIANIRLGWDLESLLSRLALSVAKPHTFGAGAGFGADQARRVSRRGCVGLRRAQPNLRS